MEIYFLGREGFCKPTFWTFFQGGGRFVKLRVGGMHEEGGQVCIHSTRVWPIRGGGYDKNIYIRYIRKTVNLKFHPLWTLCSSKRRSSGGQFELSLQTSFFHYTTASNI